MASTTPKAGPNRYARERHLVRWNDEKREQAMLALIQEAMHRGLELDWNYAARQVDPDCSGDALKQQINKRRDKLIAQGAPLTPVSNRKRFAPRRTRAVQVQQEQAANNTIQDEAAQIASQVGTPLGGMPSMFTAGHLKRQHSGTPEASNKKVKTNGDDDDVFGDDDEVAQYSESDASDWAAGKTAKKKAKKTRGGKNSLVVALKTKKDNAFTTAHTPGSSASRMFGARNFDRHPYETYQYVVRPSRAHTYSAGTMHAPPYPHQRSALSNQVYANTNSGTSNHLHMDPSHHAMNQQFQNQHINDLIPHGYHPGMFSFGAGIPGQLNDNTTFMSGNSGFMSGHLSYNAGDLTAQRAGLDIGFLNMPHTTQPASSHGNNQPILHGLPIYCRRTLLHQPNLTNGSNTVEEPESSSTQTWDFPNAHIHTPSIDTGNASGHFTTFDAPVTPASSMPVGSHQLPETPSPTTHTTAASPTFPATVSPEQIRTADDAHYAEEEPKTPEGKAIVANDYSENHGHSPDDSAFTSILNDSAFGNGVLRLGDGDLHNV